MKESYNIVDNQNDLNKKLLEDRSAFDRIDTNLNKVDKTLAETKTKVMQMTRKEYCMKFLLYIAIIAMLAADVFVLLFKTGIL